MPCSRLEDGHRNPCFRDIHLGKALRWKVWNFLLWKSSVFLELIFHCYFRWSHLNKRRDDSHHVFAAPNTFWERFATWTLHCCLVSEDPNVPMSLQPFGCFENAKKATMGTSIWSKVSIWKYTMSLCGAFWDFFFLQFWGRNKLPSKWRCSSVFPIVELTTSMRRFLIGVLPNYVFFWTVLWTIMRGMICGHHY